MRSMRIIAFTILMLLMSAAQATNLFSKHKFGSQSAVLVTDANGKDLYAWNPDKALIPASTVKIITGIAAIERFGLDFKFRTDFFHKGSTLWVKGYGDPFLTSEELDIVVLNLIRKINLQFLHVNRVVVDGTHFPLLKVPGREISNQPYDAPLAAVSANFNTINIRKSGKVIASAEPQTPITPLAKQLASKLTDGVHRINLRQTDISEQYFAELLVAKFKEHGFKGDIESKTGFTPLEAKLVYQHVNSKTMLEAVHGMMVFSNNFIANQLFLQMRSPDTPISFSASSDYVKQLLGKNLGDLQIVEGSGLSRKNKLTARQLNALLLRFEPHKRLMKSYLNGKAYAKSGSLNGVHNLAGYISKNGKDYYFTFLFNQGVPWRFRNTLMQELYATL